MILFGPFRPQLDRKEVEVFLGKGDDRRADDNVIEQAVDHIEKDGNGTISLGELVG